MFYKVKKPLIGPEEWWTDKVAVKQLVFEGKQEAVLRLPAALVMVDKEKDVALMKTYVEME